MKWSVKLGFQLAANWFEEDRSAASAGLDSVWVGSDFESECLNWILVLADLSGE